MKSGEAIVWLLLLLGLVKKRVMTFAEVRALAKSVGFPDPDLATAIAMAESGLNPFAKPKTSEQSFGLWQINIPAHPQYGELALFDPLYNAKAAFEVSRHGTDFTPWTMFKNGVYKKYLPTPPATTVPSS